MLRRRGERNGVEINAFRIRKEKSQWLVEEEA